jgi:hypothetical protein
MHIEQGKTHDIFRDFYLFTVLLGAVAVAAIYLKSK